ncbi:MAG: glycosyltransferase, partial [Candidatus Hydrogenedentota bacterium]
MRIGINLLYFLPGISGGGETVALNLVPKVVALDRRNEYFIFLNKENRFVFGFDQPNVTEIRCSVRAHSRALRILWEQLTLPAQVRKYRLDLLHCPGITSPVISKCPVVVTIYDMNYRFHPESYTRISYPFTRLFYSLSERCADKIIVISNSVKEDLIRLSNVPENKIEVVHLSADERFGRDIDRERVEHVTGKFGIRGRYILCISTTHPHKNLARLLDAFLLL